MKEKIVIFLAMSIGIAYGQFSCQAKGKFLDKLSNCTKYFDCQVDKNNSFSMSQMSCAYGELFSVEEQRCVLASNLMCRILNDGTTTSMPILIDTATTPTPKQSVSSIDNSSSINSEENFNCPGVGKFASPHPGCKKYFDCQLQSRNILLKLETCPASTVFNPEQTDCVSESAYICPMFDLTKDSILKNTTDNEPTTNVKSFNCTEIGRFAVKEPGCKHYTLCTIDKSMRMVQQIYECKSGVFSEAEKSCILDIYYKCPFDADVRVTNSNGNHTKIPQSSFLQIGDSIGKVIPAENNSNGEIPHSSNSGTHGIPTAISQTMNNSNNALPVAVSQTLPTATLTPATNNSLTNPNNVLAVSANNTEVKLDSPLPSSVEKIIETQTSTLKPGYNEPQIIHVSSFNKTEGAQPVAVDSGNKLNNALPITDNKTIITPPNIANKTDGIQSSSLNPGSSKKPIISNNTESLVLNSNNTGENLSSPEGIQSSSLDKSEISLNGLHPIIGNGTKGPITNSVQTNPSQTEIISNSAAPISVNKTEANTVSLDSSTSNMGSSNSTSSIDIAPPALGNAANETHTSSLNPVPIKSANSSISSPGKTAVLNSTDPISVNNIPSTSENKPSSSKPEPVPISVNKSDGTHTSSFLEIDSKIQNPVNPAVIPSATLNHNSSSDIKQPTTTNIAAGTTTATNISIQCPDEGIYLVKEPGCHRFFMCHATDDGRYVHKIFDCGLDEVFSEIEMSCIQDPKFKCPYDIKSTPSKTEPDGNCHSEGVYPVAEAGCKKFLTCEAKENGELVRNIHTCGENEVFAGTILYCVNDPTFVCPYKNEDTVLVGTVTNSSVLIPSNLPQIGSLQKGCSAAENTDNFTCPHTGRFVNGHSADCRSYYLCLQSPTNELLFAIVNCELGTIFDDLNLTCENAERTYCSAA